MRALIFTGGEMKDYQRYIEYMDKSDLIICADSGVCHAIKMGIKPHILVGDMDSIDLEELEEIKNSGIEVRTFPREKDFTDTQLALELALERGADKAVVLGGWGNRPDHSIANMFLMVEYKNRGLEVTLAGDNWEMFLIDGEKEILGKKGDILSLIPLSAKVSGVETINLYYPLKDETLLMGPARGISNVLLSERASVKIKKGLLLAIKIII